MMSLTRQEAQKVADLARLALTAAELEAYQRQLSAILDYAAVLDQIDVAGIRPTAHAVAQENVMRKDTILPGLTLEDALYNAAQHKDDQFLIQSVLEE
jgi:aspartyl-tRNA(Asn)/glutamyl-tRNA(Gln) amidotransferase subunit C